jgi:superfamily I DNA and RNA helicase
VGDVVPVMSRLASAAEGMLQESGSSNERVGRMLDFLPAQEALVGDVRLALTRVESLEREISALTTSNQELKGEVLQQAALVKRMDSTLWNLEKDQLRDALADDKGPRA